jgi:hypothetical protein
MTGSVIPRRSEASAVASSPYLRREPRALVHCMAAPPVAPGDAVALRLCGLPGRPVLGRDPFRRGTVLAVVNGHALVNIAAGEAYGWFKPDRLLKLED